MSCVILTEISLENNVKPRNDENIFSESNAVKLM
jgi:hypothetical protein